MIYILENIAAILLATLAALAIGAVWLRVSGRSLPGAGTLIVSALALFWCAAILAGALILAPPQASAWTMAVGSALVIWAGFVLPALGVTLLISGVSVSRTVSACAYWLVAMVVQASVMKLWGLTAPPV